MEVQVCQNIFSQFSALILFSFIAVGCCRASVKDITLQGLQSNIHETRSEPFCVLYQSEFTDGNSKLEKHFTTFHQKIIPRNEYSSWDYGKFKVDKYHRLPKSSQKIDIPKDVPHISCYIGYHVYDYSHKNKTSVKALKNWFENLSLEKQQKHLVEATLENLKYHVKSHVLAVVGFASAQKHLEVERLLEQTRSEWLKTRAYFLFAHHNTEHSVRLTKQFGIKELPAIAFVKKNSRGDFTLIRTLKSYELDQNSVNMVLMLWHIPAMKLNAESLVALTHENNTSMSAPCTLVLLHTASASPSQPALSLYWRTIYFLRQSGVHMEFAVIEVNQETIHTVSKIWPQLLSTRLPATALYCQIDREVKKVVISGRPSVSNLVPVLGEHAALLSISGEKKTIALPWGYTDPNQVSLLTEGQHGHLCTVYSHNQTINDPWYKEHHQKPIAEKEIKPLFGSWHERYDTGNLESKLPRVGTLPLLNKATWYEAIDKSHAPKHPFYPGEQKWSGEVTKTSLVIFIQGGCGNCVRKMGVFEDVKKAVEFVDGGAAYLVNCSLESELCQENKIKGFPTLVAYRGLGWMEADHCTKLDPKLQPQHVEIEYYGVLLEKHIMSWFVKIADKAVTNIRFDSLPKPTMGEPLQLVANLVPKSSKFMYAATHRPVESFYPYKCFRLACERLYNQLSCMAMYHPKVPKREFEDEEDDLVVIQILIYRADGFWATVMSAGQPLMDTLKAEEMSNADEFHKPHSYKFPTKRLKCEEDAGFCTDLITEFTKDHGRLPITRMTAEHFHIRESFIFHNNLPVIVALVYKENITENATFYQMLHSVAASLYNDMVVVTVDVKEYMSWSHSFIPQDYNKGLGEELSPLHIFPRLCVIYWHDHHHAAFYPPVDVTYTVEDPFSFEAADVIQFMRKFLNDPDSFLVSTEHF